MDPGEIGTQGFPLRVSSLPMLVKCPARIAIQMIENPERTSGPAADTGTAAHFAISSYHKGMIPDAAIAAMRSSVSAFPLADLDEAEEFARRYFRDPRNSQEAVDPEKCEVQIAFRLPPHPTDPTGKEIFFQGTSDQVRTASNGIAEVWDYKTGKDEGSVLVAEHLFQLAGYSRGAQETLGVTIGDSGIIRARGYFRRDRATPESEPPGVFFHSCLDHQQIEALLWRVRATVAAIRRGEAWFGPSAACNHCPYEGTSVCVPRAISLGLRCS